MIELVNQQGSRLREAWACASRKKDQWYVKSERCVECERINVSSGCPSLVCAISWYT